MHAYIFFDPVYYVLIHAIRLVSKRIILCNKLGDFFRCGIVRQITYFSTERQIIHIHNPFGKSPMHIFAYETRVTCNTNMVAIPFK